MFVNLANYWVNQGHSIDFVVMTGEGGLREVLSHAVRLIDLSEQRGSLSLRLDYIRLFAHYLKVEKPDQVFATLTYVTITALWAAKLAGYQGRVVVRQANSIQNQSRQSLSVCLWNWIGYHLCYRWADTILVNSRNSEAEMIAMLPHLKRNVRLIYNPVVIERTLVRTSETQPLPIVLASGRFAPQKDYPTLIRAFAKVREQSEARLVILGDGPLRAEIEELILELGLTGSVELAGYVANTADYYASASVFVLTSLWEGFPNVLVEALAAGVPVVATDCQGGSREIVEPILPENVVPVGDVSRLAERIQDTMRSPRGPQYLREYVQGRFDLPFIAEKYLEC